MSLTQDIPTGHYKECARRLRQLHALIRSGDGDPDEADELRDEMDVYWNRMRPDERDLTGELSADLNALRDILNRGESRTSDVKLRRRFLDAENAGAWDQVRTLIEAGADGLGSSDQILFRAYYWGGRGDFESGHLFLKFFVSMLIKEQEKLDRQYDELKNWVENLGSNSEEQILRRKAGVLFEQAEKARRRSNESVDLLSHQIEYLESLIEFPGDQSLTVEQTVIEARMVFFNTCSSAFLLPAAR